MINRILKNWQTSVIGLITAIINLTVAFGLSLTTSQQTSIIAVVTSLGVCLGFLFAKDSSVTGGTTPATPEAQQRVNQDKG